MTDAKPYPKRSQLHRPARRPKRIVASKQIHNGKSGAMMCCVCRYERMKGYRAGRK